MAPGSYSKCGAHAQGVQRSSGCQFLIDAPRLYHSPPRAGDRLPHLHYMIMSGEDERTSQGLPSYFDGFNRVLGAHSRQISHGQIDSGDILEYSPGKCGCCIDPSLLSPKVNR